MRKIAAPKGVEESTYTEGYHGHKCFTEAVEELPLQVTKTMEKEAWHISQDVLFCVIAHFFILMQK